MDLLDRLLEHDRWTTRQVLTICRTLAQEQLQQPFDLGPGTIDETLRHLIRNVQVWTDPTSPTGMCCFGKWRRAVEGMRKYKE